MKQAAATRMGYRRRLLLLAAGSAVLLLLVMRKRVLPTWSLWQECRRLEADQRAGVDLEAERQRLEARLAEITARSGGDGPAEDRWRAVIGSIGSGGPDAPRLIALSPEHLQVTGERTIHTLPVVLEGRTGTLLRFCDRLERGTTGVHLVSLDLHTTRPTAFGTSTGAPRKLHATLYLRTIAP